MATMTIPKKITGREELVIIPRKEFEYMKSRMVPEFSLSGKAAERLDRRVIQGLRDHKSGRTESLESFLKKEYPHLSRYAS